MFTVNVPRGPTPGSATGFDLSGGRRGVLCIHGFTGSPFEMSYLGRRLHERGLTAVSITLPGHGTSPEALRDTSWRDWYRAVEKGFDALRARCPDGVAVTGQSLGGLLALHLAARRGLEVGAVAALAVPLWLGPLPTAVISAAKRRPWLRRAVRSLPKLGGSDVSDREMRRRNPAYRAFPLRGLLELDEIMTTVREELEAVRSPLLVVHGRRDHTAPFACSDELLRRAGSLRIRRRALPRSWHLVSLDVERDVVSAEVGTFIESALGRGSELQ